VDTNVIPIHNWPSDVERSKVYNYEYNIMSDLILFTYNSLLHLCEVYIGVGSVLTHIIWLSVKIEDEK